jgi:hypothetical protein
VIRGPVAGATTPPPRLPAIPGGVCGAAAGFGPRYRAAMSCGRSLVPWLALAWVLTSAPQAAAQVQISGLSDLALGVWSGSGDLEGIVDHCVRGPRGGRYAIEATGIGSGGAFVLLNGPGSLPFQVDYSDDGGGWSQMSPGVPLTGQSGAPNENQFERCLAGQSAPQRVRVRVLAQDLGTALAGGYDGSLTLLVTPE